MKHFSYFVALAAIGTLFLLLALEPLVAIARQVMASALGLPSDSETLKIVANSAIAVSWVVVLTGYWIRKGGLWPRLVKPGHRAQLAWGRLCLAAGHVLLACIVLVKAFAFLMILPVIGVLLLYGTGIVLIERARDRSRGGRGNG